MFESLLNILVRRATLFALDTSKVSLKNRKIFALKMMGEHRLNSRFPHNRKAVQKGLLFSLCKMKALAKRALSLHRLNRACLEGFAGLTDI